MKNELIKELDRILPVVVRVHGDAHPELSKVAELYAEAKDGKDVWAELNAVTNNFTVPAGACPTFEKTYLDLSLLEKEAK